MVYFSEGGEKGERGGVNWWYGLRDGRYVMFGVGGKSIALVFEKDEREDERGRNREQTKASYVPGRTDLGRMERKGEKERGRLLSLFICRTGQPDGDWPRASCLFPHPRGKESCHLLRDRNAQSITMDKKAQNT